MISVAAGKRWGKKIPVENPDQPYNTLAGPRVLQICQGWGSINSEALGALRASWLLREGLSRDTGGADTAGSEPGGGSPEEQVCSRRGLSLDR